MNPVVIHYPEGHKVPNLGNNLIILKYIFLEVIINDELKIIFYVLLLKFIIILNLIIINFNCYIFDIIHNI